MNKAGHLHADTYCSPFNRIIGRIIHLSNTTDSNDILEQWFWMDFITEAAKVSTLFFYFSFSFLFLFFRQITEADRFEKGLQNAWSGRCFSFLLRIWLEPGKDSPALISPRLIIYWFIYLETSDQHHLTDLKQLNWVTCLNDIWKLCGDAPHENTR